MKLTDELLTQLVNEELGRVDEKKIPVSIGKTPNKTNIDSILTGSFDIPSYEKLPGRSRADAAANLKSLALGDKNVADLSSDDIENAIAVAKAGYDKPLATLGRIKKNTGDEELKSSIETELDKYSSGKQGYETGTVSGKNWGKVTAYDIEKAKSFTFPRVTSSNATLTGGEFLGSQNELMKSIFTKNTIK